VEATDAVCTPGPIAIDGPAASGKSSLGEALAHRLGMTFLDTGLMYRAFTLAALRAGVPASDHAACADLARSLDFGVTAGITTAISLGGEDVTGLLRRPDVEANVSAYSAIPAVREVLVAQQREVARPGDAILAGRDIGTVVLPEAPLKFFVTASADERARRRGVQALQDAADARSDIDGRDRIDENRAASPTRAAADAIVIDTTGMPLDAVVALALEHICGAA
jgi:cytidylate kinase